jgi:anti-sigma factor RsiW
MNEDQLLQLQAWIDGELPEEEARRVQALLSTNPEAEAIVAELKTTKGFLAGNEPALRVPETREFYWSKISREIERTEAAEVATRTPAPAPSWLLAWRRFLVPVSSLAMVAFLSVLSLNLYQRAQQDPLQHLVEVENLDETIGSISYKSQSENMFVVYLYNKEQNTETEDDFDAFEDQVLQ